jgi:hypothetical protein
MKSILLWLPRKIVRRLFIHLWSDEIVEAHKYVRMKHLQANQGSGARRDNPLREAYGAMDALMIVGLYQSDSK